MINFEILMVFFVNKKVYFIAFSIIVFSLSFISAYNDDFIYFLFFNDP